MMRVLRNGVFFVALYYLLRGVCALLWLVIIILVDKPRNVRLCQRVWNAAIQRHFGSFSLCVTL